jgi:hypothetical protein
MSMKIEFYIPEDDIRAGGAADYLARAMSAIGYNRGVSLAMPEPRGDDGTVAAPLVGVSDVSEKETDEQADEVHIVRERGKPAPGKARRTKAEIEEDEAADAADQAGDVDVPLNPTGPGTLNISTGDERVSPEDDAQDAADEAADEANATAAEPTRDDVRASMQGFLDKHGIAKLNEVFGGYMKEAYPDGSVTNLKLIPENPVDFRQAIDFLTSWKEG